MARPKGIADWKPKDHVLEILAQVNQVLDEYKDHLPLTVRQIFYRLVGQYGYDKTEQAYARLAEYMVRARRSLMIPFASVRDDGTTVREPTGFASVDRFWEIVRSNGENFRLQRQQGQPVFVELSCEASGMVPQLVRVAHPYGIPVYSGSGFNSLTAIKEIADRALTREVPTVILHVGDFDPSGVAIFDSLRDDASQFVGQIVRYAKLHPDDEDNLFDELAPDGKISLSAGLRPVRVALTYEQVVDHGLDTAPPKSSDTRTKNWPYEWTAQAEALPPDLLARIVRDAIEDHIDLDLRDDVLAQEKEHRVAILTRLDGTNDNGKKP